MSNFRRFHWMAAYLPRYTRRPIGIALGTSKLKEILDERFYRVRRAGSEFKDRRPAPIIQNLA